ncbi:hypothetical protein MA16_Dca026513 [Dendrobium catenatum]|uniref:CCHC-type domain-containing protein n=1 Tax=Dendrobium catenatum TaxID=906689 RepID=A0A2I0VCL7_9ASPA|nr:hypothetical protein MA16_Dca026513 [Dendrobium catenatum]
MLCSFFSQEDVKKVISGGPWFVNRHIIRVDKWSTKFSTTSLKGLTSLVWVRLWNLPLYYWDEINVARIASLIGYPMLIDGDMFQWGRREFARVCVRLELDKQLPMGVWVDGLDERFFQKVEYEKISTFCFNCGIIGHLSNVCKDKEISINNYANSVSKGGSYEVPRMNDPNEDSKYGPWIHVNHKRGKRVNLPFQKKKVEENKGLKEGWIAKRRLIQIRIYHR